MKKLYGLVAVMVFVACARYGLADGTVTGGDAAKTGEKAVTSIRLENLSGATLTKIPKAEAFLIWVMWTPAVDGPKVTYKFTVKQDTTQY